MSDFGKRGTCFFGAIAVIAFVVAISPLHARLGAKKETHDPRTLRLEPMETIVLHRFVANPGESVYLAKGCDPERVIEILRDMGIDAGPNTTRTSAGWPDFMIRGACPFEDMEADAMGGTTFRFETAAPSSADCERLRMFRNRLVSQPYK
jgi:hypothetical protein